MFNKFLILPLFAIALVGCGGGTIPAADSDSNAAIPTNTSLVFSLFSPQYLAGSYSVSYSLAGTDSNGETYTATQSIQSGNPSTIFVGKKPVEVIDVSTSIKNTNTNAMTEILDNKYFTHEAYTNIKYYGYNNLLEVIATPVSDTSSKVIPDTATIGNFGVVGDYIRTDGTRFSQSWKLVDGYNGKAILVLTTVSNEVLSDIYPSTVEKLLISEDGTVSSVEIIITYHQSGNIITLKTL